MSFLRRVSRSVFVTFRLALVALVVLAGSPARAATCYDTACVEIGARLTSVDSNRSYLLNSLLGGLLGSSISLQVADWQALTAAQINLLDLLQAVQSQATLGTPQDALDTTVDAVKIFNAAASVLQLRGQTVAGNAVQTIASRVGAGYIKLGDLISVCSTCLSYGDINFNALDLVNGAVSLFNYQNLASTPTPITISGASIGLSSLGTVLLYAQVLEPPVMICRPATSQFYGAALRLKLDATLASVNLTVALANQISLLGISLNGLVTGLQAQLSKVTVFASIARAQGTLQSVNALGSVVKGQAAPGLVDLYIGQIDDSVFFNHSHTINAATDLQSGTVGSLTLSIAGIPITVAIKAKASASGQSPFYTPLTFNGPFPETQTVSTSGSFVTNLVTSLLNTLTIDFEVAGLGALSGLVTGILNVTLGLLKPVLVFLFQQSLSPVVNSLLSSVLDPMLTLLGIKLGEAYITVLGARRRCTYTVSGTVYRDSNRNGFKDGTETGTSLTLYAKLISESTPTGPATSSATVDPTTGAYSFTGVAAGSYRIVIDDNTTLSDVTPRSIPSGWTATEQPSLLRVGVVVASDLPNQNFGLADVTSVAGRVFRDSGTSAGTANDGIRNGGEFGSSGVTLQLLNAGGTVLDTTTTAGDGTYQLFIGSSVAAGSILRVVETNSAGAVSTGGSAGTTGGSYNRTTDTVTFTLAAATSYTGVDFGDVPTAQLTADDQQTALPGSPVFYAHRFIAGTAGSVLFSTTHTLTPAIDGWSEVIFLDANANGRIDTGESVINGAITVTEGQTLDVIVKVLVPNSAVFGARNQAVLHADFTFTGATPALSLTLTRTDLTLTGARGTAGLALTKSVDKAAAKPGETITYTISFTNESPGSLTHVVVSDATPAFTRFAAAAVALSPSGLGAVTLTAPAVGASGTIAWSFVGELTSGATGTVTFSVTVDQ